MNILQSTEGATALNPLKVFTDARNITSIFNTFNEGHALIAGGAVRDIILKRVPKDIDILIHRVDDTCYREIEILADRMGYSWKLALDCGYIPPDTSEDPLLCVYKLTKEGFTDIDVIFLDCPPMERVYQFPCNLSQIYLRGRKVIETCAFLGAVASRTIIYNTDTVRPNYLSKMKDYFPDWKHELDE